MCKYSSSNGETKSPALTNDCRIRCTGISWNTVTRDSTYGWWRRWCTTFTPSSWLRSVPFQAQLLVTKISYSRHTISISVLRFNSPFASKRLLFFCWDTLSPRRLPFESTLSSLFFRQILSMCLCLQSLYTRLLFDLKSDYQRHNKQPSFGMILVYWEFFSVVCGQNCYKSVERSRVFNCHFAWNCRHIRSPLHLSSRCFLRVLEVAVTCVSEIEELTKVNASNTALSMCY